LKTKKAAVGMRSCKF